MDDITWTEVLKRIQDDSNINFIAEAMTPLHVLGIETLILYLESKGIKCKGFILALDHAKTGNGLKSSMFHTSSYNGVEPKHLVISEYKHKNNLIFYLSLKKQSFQTPRFYYATPFIPSFDRIPEAMELRPKDYLQVYITEEGIANYVEDPYRLYYHTLFRYKFYKYPRVIWVNLIRNRFYRNQLQKNHRLTEFSTLTRKDNSYCPNEDYAECIRKLLRTSGNSDQYVAYEGAVVFAPSLLYEGGIIDDRSDIALYKKAQEILGEGNNYIVKPHPREKNIEAYSALNCTVELNYKDSFESIVAGLKQKPKCIIGDTGSSLVYISALFGVKTISISKLIDKKHLLKKKYFNKYNETFGDLVLIPEDQNEYKKMLEEL